jgi:hypothetical protein
MTVQQSAPTISAFGLVRSGAGNLWMAAGWIAPFAVMGVAYLFPELRNTISTAMPDNLFRGLFVSLLAAGAWVAMDWIIASYRNTPTGQLQTDAIYDIIVLAALSGLGGWMYGRGTLAWWLVIPWGASFLAATISVVMGINNSSQKPSLSQRGSA